MQYRNLGSTGLKTSILSFGTYLTFGYTVDLNSAKNMMEYAYDMGINIFDNAELYAQGISETIMGRELKYFVEFYTILERCRIFGLFSNA